MSCGVTVLVKVSALHDYLGSLTAKAEKYTPYTTKEGKSDEGFKVSCQA